MTNLALADHGVSTPYHHGTHRQLLGDVPAAARYPAELDAIIVPTVRKPAILVDLIDQAAKLGCTLVVLCSGQWTCPAGVAKVARGRRAEIIAIDADTVAETLVPTMATDALLTDTLFERRSDLSLKRNLGRLYAQLAGWRRIAFLDDDITVPEPMDLRDAAGLTDTFAGVGLHSDGFPDNSVVCHAFRAAGGDQDTFVGGGALVVGVSPTASFFPNIYNEDWFFLLGADGLQEVAATGRAIQAPYDPFRDDRRARGEELGDCLAEGLFWLLDEGRPLTDAHELYWRRFLSKRKKFIAQVLDMVRGNVADSAARDRMITALRAAEGRRALITPELCAEFVRCWQADRVRWRDHVDRLYAEQGGRPIAEPAELLRSLGLARRARYLRRS